MGLATPTTPLQFTNAYAFFYYPVAVGTVKLLDLLHVGGGLWLLGLVLLLCPLLGLVLYSLLLALAIALWQRIRNTGAETDTK